MTETLDSPAVATDSLYARPGGAPAVRTFVDRLDAPGEDTQRRRVPATSDWNRLRPEHRLTRVLWTTVLSALFCALALSWHPAADAAPLAAGSTMPALSLNDQHDKPVPVGPSTRWVVFTAEKAVSDMVSAVLAAEPAGVVDRLQLVYVADISGMPALMTRMFALPRLRELPFPIALVRDQAQVAQVGDIPRAAGSATVLRLDGGRVAQVATVRQEAELRALLGLPANPAAP